MTALSCIFHPLKISVKKFTPITRVIEIAGSPWDTNVWSTGATKTIPL